ncbi:MAG: hypothetical protein KF709_06650 [Gemmatimonadaceae bacterium]|nr:hypothetical protein [Gemmatimonadaceae bacterium]
MPTRIVRTLLVALIAASPLPAQDAITTDLLDRFVTAYDAEKENLKAAEPRIAEIEEKIRKFRECKTAFEAAGSATRSRLGGLAARAGIRARCGANSEADIAKEKQEVLDKATADAASGSGFNSQQFGRLKTRLERIFAFGDRAGLSDTELAAVDARRERFSSLFGASADMRAVADAIAAVGGAGAAGARPMPGQWTADYSWMYIGQLFSLMYGTGASVFDAPYEPGQWTRWEIVGGNGDDDKGMMERAFLSRTEDGGEWWRMKSVSSYRDGSRARADTIVLEALFKPAGDGVQQLVRMRGRMPGETEANEMMVPEQMTTLRSLGMFGSRPTKESVEGATVGTEQVRTPAGSFSAKHVRFGGAGARQSWWLTDAVPGGWIKYQVAGDGDDASFSVVLVAHGTGAKSELGSK